MEATVKTNGVAAGNRRNALTVSDLLEFSKQNWLKIVLRGAISFGILILVLVIVFAVTPRKPSYDREILITLQEKDGHVHYPNGKNFSYTDIVAPGILHRVYKDNKLEGVITFKSFCDAVQIGGIDLERARIDAEYQAKLGKRNLMMMDAARIEREYKEAIAALPANAYQVRFSAPSGVSKAQAAQIANAIPEIWSQVASVLEAETFPTFPRASVIAKMKTEIGKASSLAQMEQLKRYIAQLQNVAKFLNAYGMNRNFVLPGGETVWDVRDELTRIQTYDVSMIQYGIAGASDSAGAANIAFINGNLLDVEKRLTAVNAKCSAIAVGLSRLEGGRTPVSANVGGKDGGTLQLDGAFFENYAQLIRNDANNNLRASLVKNGIDAEIERSDLEADRKYFESLKALITPLSAGKQTAVSPTDVPAKMVAVIDDLATIADKLVMFREMITKDHLSSRRFYEPIGCVRLANNPCWPFARMALALVALWGLYNLIALVLLWNARKAD